MSIDQLLQRLQVDNNEIYGMPNSNDAQSIEKTLRENVASVMPADYLEEISFHHSVPVMDYEVRRFLKLIPENGIVRDMGGCWGWHWRNKHELRPDVNIVIVDFIKSNLKHAKNLLQARINKNIWLVHGDATDLEFPDNSFDGYWTVQTLQHIPAFTQAVIEAHRILKPNGVFSNYSLNNAKLISMIYRMFDRIYVTDGLINDKFYLCRANNNQKRIIETQFNHGVSIRYSEVIFKPEFRIYFVGKENSWVGKLDSLLSSRGVFFSSISRQLSFHTIKR
jgi:SAM-dependent methyltransferase